MHLSKETIRTLLDFIKAAGEEYRLCGGSAIQSLRLTDAEDRLKEALSRAEAWPHDTNLELQLDGRISDKPYDRVDVDRNLLAKLQGESRENALRASLLQGLVDQAAGFLENNSHQFPRDPAFKPLHETLLEHSSHQR